MKLEKKKVQRKRLLSENGMEKEKNIAKLKQKIKPRITFQDYTKNQNALAK